MFESQKYLVGLISAEIIIIDFSSVYVGKKICSKTGLKYKEQLILVCFKIETLHKSLLWFWLCKVIEMFGVSGFGERV